MNGDLKWNLRGRVSGTFKATKALGRRINDTTFVEVPGEEYNSHTYWDATCVQCGHTKNFRGANFDNEIGCRCINGCEFVL